MKNSTEVIVILDRSGSMNDIVGDTIGGFNKFVEDQRNQPGECYLTLVQFDNEYEVVYEHKPISEVPPLQLNPRGTTALHDAIGRTVKSVGSQLAALDESSRPNRVLVLVLTDGVENASREYNSDTIRELVTHQQEKYNWGFIFLGADQDAVLSAKKLGFDPVNTVSYAKKDTSRAFSNVSHATTSYRAGVTTASCLVDQEDKAKLEADRTKL